MMLIAGQGESDKGETWTDAAPNEAGFEILRSANLGAASVIGATRFAVSGLAERP